MKDNDSFQEDYREYILRDPVFEVGYETVVELINIYILVIPCSNVGVEKGFSAMKRIKTEIRNRLGIGTLQDLMTISLNRSESKSWDYEEGDSECMQLNNIRNLD